MPAAPDLTLKNSVTFTGGFTAEGGIDLSGARVGGDLRLAQATFTDAEMDLRGAALGTLDTGPECLPRRLRLGGLTYTALQPYLPAAQRLEMLSRDTDGY